MCLAVGVDLDQTECDGVALADLRGAGVRVAVPGELDAAGAGPGLALALAPVADRVQGLAGLEVGRGAEGDVRGLDNRRRCRAGDGCQRGGRTIQLTLPENSKPGWLAPGICEPLPLEKITR